MVQLALMGTKTHGDIAQAFVVRQLGEHHHEILVETPKRLGIPFAMIAGQPTAGKYDEKNLRRKS